MSVREFVSRVSSAGVDLKGYVLRQGIQDTAFRSWIGAGIVDK
jgi:hypothetical protein